MSNWDNIPSADRVKLESMQWHLSRGRTIGWYIVNILSNCKNKNEVGNAYLDLYEKYLKQSEPTK